MNPRTTWLWVMVAAGLFTFIFIYERYIRKTVTGPPNILPGLHATAVTSIQVQPKGQLAIRADRVGAGWQLTQPLTFPYPAQATNIESFLAALEHLTPAAYLTEREMANRFDADEAYGFADPQDTLLIRQGDSSPRRLRVGTRTAPGDQVFLQVVGVEGVYVVDADFVRLIPGTANDWRDTTFIPLAGLSFDRIAVTNGATIFEMAREAANRPWSIVRPTPARADNTKIVNALEDLEGLRISRFVTDDAKSDLEALGLQPPELEVVLGKATNTVARLQFGKSPTNAPGQFYARRFGQNTIVTVSTNLLGSWRMPATYFRDTHLASFTSPVHAIEVRGGDNFSLVRQTNQTWRVMPQNFAADTGLVTDLLYSLTNMQVVQFVREVVTDPDLPAYGLAPPARQYILRTPTTNSSDAGADAVLAELQFGTNADDTVFARRPDGPDKSFVYSVKRTEVERLPSASWQLRDRQIWDFSTNDIAGVTIHQEGKVRQIIRRGAHQWSLAPGSQGVINDLAIEETVRGLTGLAAIAWTGHGEQTRARCGFAGNGLRITFDLKTVEKVSVEFGGTAPSGFPYAAVTFEGEPWIFEFPFPLYRDVLGCLTIPANL